MTVLRNSTQALSGVYLRIVGTIINGNGFLGIRERAMMDVRENRLCCLINGKYKCKSCLARMCSPCNDEDEALLKQKHMDIYSSTFGKALRRLGHNDSKCLDLEDTDWMDIDNPEEN